MVALLKQKSKVQMNQKSRNSYTALEIGKRKKIEQPIMPNVTIRQD